MCPFEWLEKQVLFIYIIAVNVIAINIVAVNIITVDIARVNIVADIVRLCVVDFRIIGRVGQIACVGFFGITEQIRTALLHIGIAALSLIMRLLIGSTDIVRLGLKAACTADLIVCAAVLTV